MGGINLLKMANLLEQCACKLKDEALDRLNVVLAGTDVSGLWALLKDTLGTASETGYMYEEGPPVKCSHPSSVTSDIATEEEIALAVPDTSTNPHSLTSTLVCLKTFSLDQYNSSVIPTRPMDGEDPNHIGLPEELIPIHTNIDGKSLYPCRWISAPMPQYKIRHPNACIYEGSTWGWL